MAESMTEARPEATSQERGVSSAPRIPLNTFTIGLGLAGLAEVWSAAVPVLGLPTVVALAFWGVAVVAWLWLIAAHLVRGRRSGQPLAAQLRHPAQGPLAAIVPIIGMLIGAELSTIAPVPGAVLVLVSLTATALLASWLIGTWLTGRIELGAVHGGYLLPTVAGGFVAAAAASTIGLDGLGWGAFGVGMLFWVVMTTVVVVRLVTRPTLPDALVPTLTVLVAPPAVGGIALFDLTDSAVTPFSLAFAGLGVVLVLVQLALLPRYRRLPFSLGFWSFTFPTAAVVAYTIDWLAVSGMDAQGSTDAGRVLVTVASVVLAVAFTVFVAIIGIRSLRLVAGARALRRAEAVLTRADDLDARTTR